MTARLRRADGVAVFVLALGAASSIPAASRAQSATAEAPNPDCVSRPDCRFVGTVTIRTDAGVKTPALNRNMPFLRTKDGHVRLWLVLGERVDLRLGTQGEPPLVVIGHGSASDAQKSKDALKDKIEVDFNQMKDSTYTVMTVRNGYGRQLQYVAYLLASNGAERPTSICPIAPGIFSMESWPGPVLEIELTDFQLADAGPTTTCK